MTTSPLRKIIPFMLAVMLLGMLAMAGTASALLNGSTDPITDEYNGRPVHGAIFTTLPFGQAVNANVQYKRKIEVYLDGGPRNPNSLAAGLNDGLYVFQITDPPGKNLLSQDPARCRVVQVKDGVILGTVPAYRIPGLGATSDNWDTGGKTRACHVESSEADGASLAGQHDTNVDSDLGGGMTVQMMPFLDTPNPGGVYKAWITPLAVYVQKAGNISALNILPKPAAKQTTGNAPDPGFKNPSRNNVKTDNFKVIEKPPFIEIKKYVDGVEVTTWKWVTAFELLENEWNGKGWTDKLPASFAMSIGGGRMLACESVPAGYEFVSATLNGNAVAPVTGGTPPVPTTDDEANPAICIEVPPFSSATTAAVRFYNEVPNPKIKIVKKTNGTNDSCPSVLVGSTVTWTYEVTNIGNRPLSNIVVTDDQGVTPIYKSGDANNDGKLDLTETWLYEATGKAVKGQYKNVGTATGSYNSTQVSATDPDCYFGADPKIEIVKKTNGTDNNSPTGPYILVGDPVKWTYEVTNPGNVPLSNVQVTDDQGVTPIYKSGDANNDGKLDLTETWLYEATGKAVKGQYKNVGESCGYYDSTKVCDDDPDHYLGVEPKLTIVKTPDGQEVNAGDALTFSMVVSNSGDGTAKGVTLSDPLPTGTASAWTTATQDCSISGTYPAQQTLNCTMGDLPPGASFSASVSSSTSFAYCTVYNNTATASATNHPNVSDPGSITCQVQWKGETATGAGFAWSATQGAPSNWFMYTPWSTQSGHTGISTATGANLIAGQYYTAGKITGTSTSTANSITITLNSGFRFAGVASNVKIHPMSCTTNQPYVEPGQFSVHRTAQVSANSITVTGLSKTACYGIHVDVERAVQ